jgi:ribosomal protein S18 acetylase RimI-like enzyme
MTAPIAFRNWTEPDLLFAKKMTDLEDWGNSLADFERIRRIQPDGCFVALKKNQPVGMISAASYGDYGFLGSLIVSPSHRGSGIGAQLMQQGIKFLRDSGATCIELDGTMMAVPLYRRLGFKDKWQSLRFKRLAAPLDAEANGLNLSERVRPIKKTEWPKLFEFDRVMLGFDRARVLNIILEEFPDICYGVFDGSQLLAYLIVRPIDDQSSQVGPLVTRDNTATLRLISEALIRYSDRNLSIGIPGSISYACHWILRQGFVRHAPALRMYLGEKREYEARVACILSPEKG